MRTKKTMIITSLGALVLAAVLAAPGRSQTGHTIDIKSKEGIGSYLVDSKGMTLYNLKKDPQGMSTCTGECAVMWPPFHTEHVTVPPGLKASDFGAITRDDGKKQTTCKGMPLYYFAGDEKPGDTNGNGVFNIWFPAALSGGSW